MKLINPRQAELMGIFAALPTNVTTHYLSKFQKGTPFMTASDSFNVIELMKELISLSIVPRGTKAPDIKINGHNTINIRPDIIKGTATSDGLNIPRRIYKGEEELDTDASSDSLAAVVLREGRVDRDLVAGLDYTTDYTGIAELERNRIYLEEVLDNETN